MSTHVETNPELDQDRAFDLYDTYKKYGYVMFPQQRLIYKHIASMVVYQSVLEIGCGNGVGTAMIHHNNRHVFGTDKLPSNVEFARELYPWIPFAVVDVSKPIDAKFASDVVVAVEIIEHVADSCTAMKHMLNVAKKTVWISTPNGRLTQHEKPPSNPYHVAEYTPEEMLGLIHGACAGRPVKVFIYAFDDFNTPLTVDTDKNPLVYRIDLQ